MAFIAIDSDTSWQELAIAEELAISYNLRRALCGLSAIDTPTQATEVYAFVRAMQEGIEAMADDLWFNNSAALSGYTGQSAYPSIMSLAGAMTAAGLTASGYWRRIAEGGTQPTPWTSYTATGWSYGKITDKDLAGPWLFKDLQLALTALTRANINLTEWRSKNATAGGASSIPSTAMSWGAWGSGTPNYSTFEVYKGRFNGAIYYPHCEFRIREYKFSIDEDLAAFESSRICLVIPHDPDYGTHYADYAAKKIYDNLVTSDITSVFDLTVENTTDKTTADGSTSYSAILGEDADNVIPIANDILPDSNVPNTPALAPIAVSFHSAMLIVDFAFE